MPKSDIIYFPVHLGLLSPEHKQQIGSALWEFLWLIARTTKESQDEDGETWGIVLGGKPIKLSEISEQLGSSEHTVKKNITKLKKYGYIDSKRAPYGEIFKVKKSKKFKKRQTENGLSDKERQIKNGLSEQRDRPKMVERQTKNGLCNKDIKDIKVIDIKQQQDIKENEVDVVENNPFVEYEKFFGFPPAVLIQEFNYWIDESQFQEPEAILCEVIMQASKQAPRNPASYIKAIIKKHHDMELYTLADVQEYNRKFEEHRNGGGSNGRNQKHRGRNEGAPKKSPDESITGGQVGWIGKR
ncbi:DnaD domain protein [Niallia taxi]|uniref:DnaD domain protein n=1 Tax=Niallia taxi TaxID=2499688 RepID=UPI002E22ABC3|nr:DnaD domain protein [Niallia taxi]MED4118095.1 DnaD domain protein [Niallia taxi]